MKTKNLKLLGIFLLLLPLCVVLLGAGCKKVEEPNYYDPTSIIGKWEWIYSIGGDLTASYSYPQKGQTLIIEFSKNGELIFSENGNDYEEKEFTISQDTLKYFDNNKIEYTYIFKMSGDTLALESLYTILSISFYKRIK